MPWPDGDGIGGGGGNALLRYAKIVLEDGPVGYWPGLWRSPVGVPPLEPPAGLPVSWQRWWLRGGLVEVVGGRNGRFVGRPPARGSGIDGLGSVHFASQPGQYVELADDPRWSLMPGNHGLTVEVWLRPDRLEFTDAAGAHTDYIHWLGKGVGGAHEWTFRLYSLTNTARRPNRLSFYAFNLGGGEGAGADAAARRQHPGRDARGRVATPRRHAQPLPRLARPRASRLRPGGCQHLPERDADRRVAAGDSNDSYWGFPDNAAGTLAQPVSFPLANGILALESAAGFRTHGTLIAAVEDDGGHFHPVGYTGVKGSSLIGCTAEGAGNASSGAAVRQGAWEIRPEHGQAPLRFGTRDLAQYLPGSLCHIAVYQKVLPPSRILHHYQAGHATIATANPNAIRTGTG